MDLQSEVDLARKKIIKDGFDMSVGEIMRIYERGELIINPAYQRMFRWDNTRKTNFIESLLLSIPIPPIFVFTDENGKWELIDGLQRLSTIFQFAGILKDESGAQVEQFSPNGTRMLPSLCGAKWENDGLLDDALPLSLRLDIERVRLRVEILKRESDSKAKYELFQRLNTGGATLSPQEVRNCVTVMLNRELFEFLNKLADSPIFISTANITSRAQEEQKHVELVLRYLAYRYRAYDSKIDVHDWLDDILIEIAQDGAYSYEMEEATFIRTFSAISDALGPDAFKRFENGQFMGGFSISAFEAITIGVSRNIPKVELYGSEVLKQRVIGMWEDERFREGTKAGIRGSTRLSKILPIVDEWFQ